VIVLIKESEVTIEQAKNYKGPVWIMDQEKPKQVFFVGMESFGGNLCKIRTEIGCYGSSLLLIYLTEIELLNYYIDFYDRYKKSAIIGEKWSEHLEFCQERKAERLRRTSNIC
jgi:hypothetical protein